MLLSMTKAELEAAQHKHSKRQLKEEGRGRSRGRGRSGGRVGRSGGRGAPSHGRGGRGNGGGRNRGRGGRGRAQGGGEVGGSEKATTQTKEHIKPKAQATGKSKAKATGKSKAKATGKSKAKATGKSKAKASASNETPRKAPKRVAESPAGGFLSKTAKKRAAGKAKRMQDAVTNLQFLKDNASILKGMTFPAPGFKRQSFSVDPPERGDFGAVDRDNASSIGIIVDRGSFYVKHARIAPELEPFAQVDGNGGATIGWNKSPTVKWALSGCIVLCGNIVEDSHNSHSNNYEYQQQQPQQQQ
ncbi:unnamed protein product [Symbiodinium necroappetens]|uniref:Uncharacterized protein n=1 Tax=Symbiodinium necroappetens TaxID=1628268 RepID=A0A812W2D0_9DINO|nr:unnamed protein product [Symbiodinium necroappetens]